MMKHAIPLLLGALLTLALAGLALAQPKIPHTLEGRDNCLACHAVGGIKPFPADHVGRPNEVCRSCHQPGAVMPSPTAAPTVPAALPTPIPLAPGRVEPTCVTCHRRLSGPLATVVADWDDSIHKPANVLCNSCHGGDPNAPDKDRAMSPLAGFRGKPAKADIPALCGSCHSDPTKMRQYGLPTSQQAEYRTSQHGLLLAKGDTKVATCYDCHGGHAVRKKNDPKATVYPTNVPATCAYCHSNTALMEPYKIPTNQADLFKGSIHGITLLQKQDMRAPSCASCHGTHGAMPPGIAEVANVCGQCHSATEELYLKGGHASGVKGSGAPRCINCHGYHDVPPSSEEGLLGSEPRQCGSCHPPGSPQRQTVEKITTALTDAAAALRKAHQAVAEAEANGMIVVAERERLLNAQTSLIQARAVQHTVQLATVEEQTKAVQEISRQVQEAAAKAVANRIFYRQVMVVAVMLIALIIVLLWLVKRQLDAELDRTSGG